MYMELTPATKAVAVFLVKVKVGSGLFWSLKPRLGRVRVGSLAATPCKVSQSWKEQQCLKKVPDYRVCLSV